MNKKLVIIGGALAGTKAAIQARKEDTYMDIKVFERGRCVSLFTGALPYFVGNVIKDINSLIFATPEYMKSEFNIDFYTSCEVTKILPLEKKVVVRDIDRNSEFEEEYDKLIIATGAEMSVPDIEGAGLRNIFLSRSVEDAATIRKLIKEGQIKKAVVVGGGPVGLQFAENLTLRDVAVTVVEPGDHILPGFDVEIADVVRKHMEEKGVEILTGEVVLTFIGNTNGRVVEIHTPNHILPADMVVWTEGLRPNVKLARDAGIDIGKTGAIWVNRYMETSIAGIYAAGSCTETVNLINGKPLWCPLESIANRMGRVAGMNVCHDSGSGCSLDGVLNTVTSRIFNLNIARTGLSLEEAKRQGYDAEAVLASVYDRPDYYPGYRNIIAKLVIDKQTRNILGAQIVGEDSIDGYIDVMVTVMSLNGKIEDLFKLDIAYSPPFLTPATCISKLANRMIDKLKGKIESISPAQLCEELDNPDILIIDVRTEEEVVMGTIPGAVHIPLEYLESRAKELDKDRRIVLVCRDGERSYFAYLTLKNMGFEHVRVLDGGIATYPYELV